MHTSKKLDFSLLNTKRLRLELNLLRIPFRNCKKKHRELKKNCGLNKNVTRFCKRTWNPRYVPFKTYINPFPRNKTWKILLKNYKVMYCSVHGWY